MSVKTQNQNKLGGEKEILVSFVQLGHKILDREKCQN